MTMTETRKLTAILAADQLKSFNFPDRNDL